jgi:hypothetical protein
MPSMNLNSDLIVRERKLFHSYRLSDARKGVETEDSQHYMMFISGSKFTKNMI